MGFLLLDQPNPNGQHFYPTRRNRVLAIVVHITAGSEDLDALDDNSAESVAQYAATTSTEVSWHTGSDADSWVDLLPSSYTAWHASNYNSCTHGHEISKRSTDWRNVPATWKGKTLRMAALGPDGRRGLRAKAIELAVPFRWATKAELDHALATGGAPVGFITHAELQWADRRDPGYVTEGGQVIDTFPRDEFMQLLRQEHGQEDDDMLPTLIKSKTDAAVYELHHTPAGWRKRHVNGTEWIMLCQLYGEARVIGSITAFNQAEIDNLTVAETTGREVWNYAIPTVPGNTPSAFEPAHQVVAAINQNTSPAEEKA